MWHYVFGQIVPIVVKDHSAFILRVKQSALYASTASPWRWWYRVPFKTLGITVQVTQSHIPENVNLQPYHCGNFKLIVLENTLLWFIFLLKHKFYLNLTSFYLKNKLFCDRIGQHFRLSDTYKDLCTHWNISQHSLHCGFMWAFYFHYHCLYGVRFFCLWL